MGVFGIALGPAFVLRFGSLILPLWLIALGALFAGRWPGGLPPAWESGEASPLPSAAERRAAASDAAEGAEPGRNGEVDPVGPGVRAAGRRRGRRDPDRLAPGWAPRKQSWQPAWRSPLRVWPRAGSAKLDTDRAESAIRSGITRQTGVKIDTVRCPEDVEARRGETFRCVARASNGQRARVEVTQRDDEGSVSLAADRGASSGTATGDGPGRRSTRGRHVAGKRKGPRPSDGQGPVVVRNG